MSGAPLFRPNRHTYYVKLTPRVAGLLLTASTVTWQAAAIKTGGEGSMQSQSDVASTALLADRVALIQHNSEGEVVYRYSDRAERCMECDGMCDVT